MEDRQETSSEALIRGEAVIEAIKTMQRFGGLSPSGQMDNQTLEVSRDAASANLNQSKEKGGQLLMCWGWFK